MNSAIIIFFSPTVSSYVKSSEIISRCCFLSTRVYFTFRYSHKINFTFLIGYTDYLLLIYLLLNRNITPVRHALPKITKYNQRNRLSKMKLYLITKNNYTIRYKLQRILLINSKLKLIKKIEHLINQKTHIKS